MPILVSFVISFLIGLLLGIERERSHPKGTQAIGVRTFILIAMLGTLAIRLNEKLLTLAIAIFVFAMIIISYYRSTSQRQASIDIGITTELAAGIVFVLGMLIPVYPMSSIIISAVVLLVLMERHRLHQFAREKLKPPEIEAAIILIIFSLGILPLLPNRTIDPWLLFNPKKFGLLVIVIASMQFAGYLAIRLFGQILGNAIQGFFGGLISSTIVFATLRDHLHTTHTQWAVMSAGVLAVVAMLIETAVILLFASNTLFMQLILPLTVMISTGMVIAGTLAYIQRKTKVAIRQSSTPLSFSTILYSTLFIATMLLLIAITKRYAGTTGIHIITFLSALFEAHAVILATSLLYIEKQLTLPITINLLANIIVATFISKFILLFALTPRYFALRMSGLLLVILSAGALAYFFIV